MATTAYLYLICPVFADNLDERQCRPNIVLILADDFGYELLGCNGGTSYRTPQLDRLAAEGARFEHCYVQPLCTPTRVQLMTGQYNVRNYLEFGTLLKDQTTFGHLFRDAGYATCITGKWQLGRDLGLPKHFGFDEYCLWQLSRRPERYKNPGLEINGKEVDYSAGEYGPDIVNDYAIDFVRRSKDRPFFLYYPMMLTHSPYVPTPDSDDYKESQAVVDQKPRGAKKAAGKKAADSHRHFTDMVEYTDKLIGKLVATLDELKLRENTVVVFVGDNGTGKGTRSMMGDRVVIGGKGTTDESGMRVPLIVNCPGLVKSGQVRRDLVDSTDFLPTICAAAGMELSKSATIDGRSFWPACRGDEAEARRWIYCWYSQTGGAKAKFEFARTHDFKLYADGRLFDVRDGDFDRKPLDAAKLDEGGARARDELQQVLDGFRDVRPARLHKPGRAAGEAGE